MKRKHKFKVDSKHTLIVYQTKSKTLYDKFLTVVENINPSQAIYGTTMHHVTTKEQYIEQAKKGINLYKKTLT